MAFMERCQIYVIIENFQFIKDTYNGKPERVPIKVYQEWMVRSVALLLKALVVKGQACLSQVIGVVYYANQTFLLFAWC